MAFEQRDMSGALFRNERKAKGDTKPDYTGKAMVNGQMVDISAWIKPWSSRPGQNYMSLSFKPPYSGQQQGVGEYQGEPSGSRMEETQNLYKQAKRGVPPQPLRPMREPQPPITEDEIPF